MTERTESRKTYRAVLSEPKLIIPTIEPPVSSLVVNPEVDLIETSAPRPEPTVTQPEPTMTQPEPTVTQPEQTVTQPASTALSPPVSELTPSRVPETPSTSQQQPVVQKGKKRRRGDKDRVGGEQPQKKTKKN